MSVNVSDGDQIQVRHGGTQAETWQGVRGSAPEVHEGDGEIEATTHTGAGERGTTVTDTCSKTEWVSNKMVYMPYDLATFGL